MVDLKMYLLCIWINLSRCFRGKLDPHRQWPWIPMNQELERNQDKYETEPSNRVQPIEMLKNLNAHTSTSTTNNQNILN